MNHTLVLLHARDEHPRTPWRPTCACGEWTGRPQRHRHEAIRQYRRHHLAIARSRRASGYKPRPPTSPDLLPLALQPLVVTFT